MKFFLFPFLILCSINVNAQFFHITAYGGVSNYQGDLQDKKFTFEQSHPCFAGGILYELTDKLFLRLNCTVGKISGDDKKAEKNKLRNLNFTSSITDLHVGAEYLLLNPYKHPITPYIFAGISAFHFDPYTTTTTSSEKIYLQPLGTEGQGFYQNRKKYKLNQIAIPFGGGIKLAINENIRVGFEIGLRKLFTDYVDDVSTTYVNNQALLTANNGTLATELSFRGDELNPPQSYPTSNSIRGNPKSKDWYYFSLISISTRIPQKIEIGTHKNKQLGCPRL